MATAQQLFRISLFVFFISFLALDCAAQKVEVAQDSKLVEILIEGAKGGSTAAQLTLGKAYLEGQGVPKDVKEAAHWFQLAADHGVPDAQFQLSLMYLNGEGVPKDAVEEVRWCRKAAEQGYSPAQAYLGVLYSEGDEGVPKDGIEAARWSRLAAEQNLPLGQAQLGHLYDIGEGVPKDEAEALRWWRKSAEHGFGKAKSRLCAYESDCANNQNDSCDTENARWCKEAAEEGSPGAQIELAIMYVHGKGMPVDNAEAYFWTNIAATVISDIRDDRDKIGRTLTTEKRLEVQEQCRKWMESHHEVSQSDYDASYHPK